MKEPKEPQNIEELVVTSSLQVIHGCNKALLHVSSERGGRIKLSIASKDTVIDADLLIKAINNAINK